MIFLGRSSAQAWALALVALLATASCSLRGGTTRRATVFESAVVLTLRDHASDPTFEACFARLREIDSEMNMWDPDSELSRLNARAGEGPIPVSRDLSATAARGLELARLSDGVFDPTVAPLVKLWGIGTAHPRAPTRAEIEPARKLVDWRRVKVDVAASTVELGRGQSLDFGALAKGYGAIEGLRLLAERGVSSAVLDVGGCVGVIGSGPRGAAWRIGVQDPSSPRGTPLGYFSVRDGAVDTSGVYERFFETAGRRYAHIFDPRTGNPLEGRADGGAISATVALPRNLNADGPALPLLVLGPVDGLVLADKLGLAAVILDARKRVYLSKAARGSFRILDSSYSIAEVPTRP